MSLLKRITVGTSVLALSSGVVLSGAGVSGAQGSSDVATGLGLAAAALNGPVKVTPNAGGGPTVAYANDTGAGEKCVGATMPFASVLAAGLDLTGDKPTADLVPKTREIQEMGGVSVLNAGLSGNPEAYEATEYDGIAEAISMLTSGYGGMGVDTAAEVTWTAPTPEAPAIAAMFCIPDSISEPEARAAAIALRIGIDPEAALGQLNGMLPGGSITGGSVSGGSVEMGATVLGSLAGGGNASTGNSAG